MPLENAAPGTPGFSRNIKREVEAGKPQKQAVAIAYSKARGDMERQDADTEQSAYKEGFENGEEGGNPSHWRMFDKKNLQEAWKKGRAAGLKKLQRKDSTEQVTGMFSAHLDAALEVADSLYERLDSAGRGTNSLGQRTMGKRSVEAVKAEIRIVEKDIEELKRAGKPHSSLEKKLGRLREELKAAERR